MECTCSISIDSDEGPSCYKQKIRKARKTHRCHECFKDILPGEKYENISGIWDGDPSSYKTCLDCKSLRDVFFQSWACTAMWDDFRENFNMDSIPEKCLAALTPVTRARVCELIENDWELYEEDF
jgi:hypothetical protein